MLNQKVQEGMINISMNLNANQAYWNSDVDGKGVVAGLTEISEINAFLNCGESKIPCEGELYYRGVNIQSLVDGFLKDNRFGFEETI